MANFVPTRSSKLKDEAQNFIIVSYKPSKKKENLKDVIRKNNPQTLSKDESDEGVNVKKKQELEMKRTRFEVMKFGMKGFKKSKVADAKIALAVSLGAKLPKNKCVNYKTLQADRQEEKKLAEENKYVTGFNNSMLKSKKKHRNQHKRKPDGILGIYGKVQKNIK